MNKIRKAEISVFLMMLLLISVLPLCPAQRISAFVRSPKTQECEVYHSGGRMEICIKAKPDANVGIEVIRPQKEASFPIGEDEGLMDVLAYVSQLKADNDGFAHTIISLDDDCGTYKVLASNAENLSVTIPDEFFAISWDEDYFDPRVYSYYLLTKEKMDTLGAEGAANEAKEFLKGRPKGTRAIMIHSSLSYLLHKNAEDFIWWDSGGAELKSYIESFFKAFKEAGGEADVVRSDHEVTMDLFSLRSRPEDADASWDPLKERFEVIVANPRYKDEIRPLLKERGYVFPEDETKCELYDVCYYDIRKVLADGNLNGYIWNGVMSSRRASYINEAMFEPILKYFPECSYSNSGSSKAAGWFEIPDGYGHRGYLVGGGVGTGIGTHSTFMMFGNIQSLQEFTPEGYSGKYFDNTPFNGLLYFNNKARAAVLSTTGGKFQPSIGRYDYVYHAGYNNDTTGEETGAATFPGTPYWHENMIHTALLNPDPILYFGMYGDGILTDTEEKAREQAAIFSEMLTEINVMVGTADRKTLVNNITSWNSKYILSGMYSGGKNIWRITPDLSSGVTIDEFCTDSLTPTFSVGNETITFPGGEIVSYEGSDATYGYWVKTDKDTKPVITYDIADMEIAPFATELELFRRNNGILMTDDILPENSGITGKLSYENLSESNQPIFVIATQYEGNRLIEATVLAEEIIPSGAVGNMICSLSEIDARTTKVKFMIWESKESLKPIIDARELKKNG